MYILNTHTGCSHPPRSKSYIQMRENEMRWKSKDQIKPSMESVGRPALSCSSLIWSPLMYNPAIIFTFLTFPINSHDYNKSSRSWSQAHHSFQTSNQKQSLMQYFIFNWSTSKCRSHPFQFRLKLRVLMRPNGIVSRWRNLNYRKRTDLSSVPRETTSSPRQVVMKCGRNLGSCECGGEEEGMMV